MANRQVPTEFLRSLDARALPLAPGHNWDDPAFRANHAKPQSLSNEFQGKKRIVYDPQTSPRGSLRGTSDRSVPSTITAQSAHQLIDAVRATEEGRSETLSHATYATLDDKVLRFYAYVVENVKESALEVVRYRLMTITYYPADDSILVQEPVLPNSGLAGGTILKRQTVPANPRQLEAFPEHTNVNLDHIRVGGTVVLHNTHYVVYACDNFTRSFLYELGVDVAPNGSPPDDNYATKLRATTNFNSSASFGVKSQDRAVDDVIRTQRFLADSGKVLKFYALSDERNDGGRIRNVELQLFVEDDTISITERQNSAEAVPSTFLSRRRIPKDGSMEKTVELTFANRVNGMRETDLGGPEAYYGPYDLDVGVVVNVYGRRILLCSTDDFTKEYYQRVLGAPLQPALDISTVAAREVALTKANRPTLPLPPYTGYGTYEDSLSSCKSLALKAPKGTPLDPHSRRDVLRFQLRLHNPERFEDKGRLFVLSYHIDDGEIVIAETAIRNSGFTGGKFCKKQRLIKSFDGANPTFYTLDDLKLGAVLNINQFMFEITTCDLHTENHMMYPATKGVPTDQASLIAKPRLLQLLTALRGFITVRYVTQTEAFRAFDCDRDGSITYDELHNGLKSHLITDNREEAMAVFYQIASKPESGHITHQDFFQWLTTPVAIRNVSGDAHDATIGAESLVEVSNNQTKLHARNAVLRSLKERLEARCLNGFEMFRMSSTMPRAYKGRRSDIQSLANIDKDSVITPVQLHRCVDEVLGLGFTESEIKLLLEFFFPEISPEERLRRSDVGLNNARVELKTFQDRFYEMVRIGQLPA